MAEGRTERGNIRHSVFKKRAELHRNFCPGVVWASHMQ